LRIQSPQCQHIALGLGGRMKGCVDSRRTMQGSCGTCKGLRGLTSNHHQDAWLFFLDIGIYGLGQIHSVYDLLWPTAYPAYYVDLSLWLYAITPLSSVNHISHSTPSCHKNLSFKTRFGKPYNYQTSVSIISLV